MGWFTRRKRHFKRRLELARSLSSRRRGPKFNDWYTVGGSRGYVTTSTVPWLIGGKHSDWMHLVPIGFEFESSVPPWLTWILPPDHPYFLFPAAIHDSLIEGGYTRPLCDGEWLSAARYVGAPKYLREFAFLAIRLKQLVRGLMSE